MDISISNAPEILVAFFIGIAVVCIVTSIITQVTKNTTLLNKIPTELEVIVITIVLSIVGLFVLSSMFSFEIVWYYIIVAVIIGFFASYVTMFGWESLINIINKFKVPSELREVYKLTSSEKKELNKIISTTEDKVEDIEE